MGRHSRSRSRSPSYFEEEARLHIGDLPLNVNKRDLEREFEKYGEMIELWIAKTPPCFAFAVYKNRNDALDAMYALNGKSVCGSHIRVTMALPRGGKRVERRPAYENNLKCYSCGERGHFARNCRQGFKSTRNKWSPSPRNRRSRSMSGGRGRGSFNGNKFGGREYRRSPSSRSRSKSNTRSRSVSRSESSNSEGRERRKKVRQGSESEERIKRRLAREERHKEVDRDRKFEKDDSLKRNSLKHSNRRVDDLESPNHKPFNKKSEYKKHSHASSESDDEYLHNKKRLQQVSSSNMTEEERIIKANCAEFSDKLEVKKPRIYNNNSEQSPDKALSLNRRNDNVHINNHEVSEGEIF